VEKNQTKVGEMTVMPNDTLQRMGETVAVPMLLIQTQVGGGFPARR